MQDGLILLVGDDHATTPILEAEGYQVFRSETGFEALGLLDQMEPDLILLDFDLPGLGGIDTLMALKGNPDTHRIGVLVLGDIPTDLTRAFAAGADEFMIATPAHELVARAAHLIGRKRELDILYRQANYDALTGVLNRGAFMERLERHAMRSVRDGRSLCAIMLDLDQFKALNDRFGHPAGDRILHQVGELLRRNVRATDVVGRYGGEEFALALPDTGLMGGTTAAKRLRDLLAWNVTLEDVTVTASFGVAQSRREADVNDLLERADQALYHAKNAGRNLVSYEYEGSFGTTADEP